MSGDLPDVNSGLFPDGLLGIKGWRRNQALIDRYAEHILGEQSGTLETLGQVGAVENLIEQARRAPNRAEQRPYLSALATLTDQIGVFEFEREQGGLLDERVTTSLADAARFVDVHERESLAQLADGMLRAQERAQFDPDAGMEDMRAIEGELRTLVDKAGERLNDQLIAPLREYEFNVSGTEQQIKDEAGDNRWEEKMHPALVTQVLELAGANLGMSKDGKWSFAFSGFGFTPDQVPEMTYAQGLATLTSSVRGKQQYVAQQMERRGAPNVMAVRERLDAPPPQSNVGGAAGSVIDTVTDALRSGQTRTFSEWNSLLTGAPPASGASLADTARNALETVIAPAQELARRLRERRARRASNAD